MNLYIETTGNQKEIIIATAEIFGLTVCDEYKRNDCYPYLIYPGYGKSVAGSEMIKGRERSTFEEILEHITGIKKVVTIRLNDSYKAEITKENVKVGCQTFTHEAIEKLYHASKSAIK